MLFYNRPRSIFGVVFYVSKSLLGIEKQKKLKKLQFWSKSLGVLLEYLYIERGLFAPKGEKNFKPPPYDRILTLLSRVFFSKLPTSPSEPDKVVLESLF